MTFLFWILVFIFSAPTRKMAGVKPPPRTNWGNVGAGAAAGLFAPSILGLFGGVGGGGGVADIISLLPLLLLGGGALYAVSVLKQK
jgi:hypothetical protein